MSPEAVKLTLLPVFIWLKMSLMLTFPPLAPATQLGAWPALVVLALLIVKFAPAGGGGGGVGFLATAMLATPKTQTTHSETKKNRKYNFL
jgi:hypothetical protein